MSISRKPTAKAPSAATIDAVINKGGSVASASPKKADKAKVAPVVIRIPTALLQQLDQLLDAQTIKKPRHTWILEAIAEKLAKESK